MRNVIAVVALFAAGCGLLPEKKVNTVPSTMAPATSKTAPTLTGDAKRDVETYLSLSDDAAKEFFKQQVIMACVSGVAAARTDGAVKLGDRPDANTVFAFAIERMARALETSAIAMSRANKGGYPTISEECDGFASTWSRAIERLGIAAVGSIERMTVGGLPWLTVGYLGAVAAKEAGDKIQAGGDAQKAGRDNSMDRSDRSTPIPPPGTEIKVDFPPTTP